jgi:hypothetical protein
MFFPEIIESGKKKILPQPKCELLGPVSLVIQSCLGLIAMCSLILKRRYERPKRPWKVWFFDVSKQLFGAAGVHLLNLTLSLIKSHDLLSMIDGDVDDDDPGECEWYFINLLLDTTIGVPILYVCLVIVYQICEFFQMKDIESGSYGKPPSFLPYFKQLMIFMCALIMMKAVIYLLLYFPIFIMYADWVLSWSDGFPNLQVVLVVLVFPIMLNCFQYYIVDNIIKFPTDL